MRNEPDGTARLIGGIQPTERGKRHVRTILFLTISNIFMTFAWYGHLKYRSEALWKVVLASWSIAFFEYSFQVPANRIGSYEFSTAQLKTIQEVITLAVFSAFSMLYLRREAEVELRRGFRLHSPGGLLRFPQVVADLSNLARLIFHHPARCRGGQTTTSCRRAKCKSGFCAGNETPAASDIVFLVNSTSAICSFHGG